MKREEFEVYLREPIENMLTDVDHVLEPWQVRIMEARLKEILELAEFNCF